MYHSISGSALYTNPVTSDPYGFYARNSEKITSTHYFVYLSMKTIFIGDIHGRPIWKDIVAKENADRVIFIGDYFDSFSIPGIDQIHNFKEIVEYKKTSDKEVTLLVGNHDFHYMNVGETYSGFQPALKFDIEIVLKENMEHLQMAYSFDKFLCTHAGVSSVFMNRWFKNTWNCDNLVEKLNETFTYSPFIFRFNGWDPYGDDVVQSPIWIVYSSVNSCDLYSRCGSEITTGIYL